MLKTTPSDDTIPFIVTTPARQSVEAKRKLIRSHVMRGKNRKKRRSMPLPWMTGTNMTLSVCRIEEHALSIPTKVGGEFSLPALPVDMCPDMLESIWKLKHAMSPLDLGLASDQPESSWLTPIWNDAACLHFTVFIAKAYLDFIQGHNAISKTALAHFVTALTILQQRLAGNDDLLSTSDSTILVVVGLIMAATVLSDLDAAQKHLDGLHKMVMLRGGMSTLSENRLLQTKIYRQVEPIASSGFGLLLISDSADLGLALGTGCQGLFFSENVSWNSLIASQGILVSAAKGASPDPSPDLTPFLDILDPRVRLAWDDLSGLTRGVNKTKGEPGIDKDLYQSAMISIHYRLVNLGFDAGDVNETTRLGLLAFASTVFLAFRGVKTRYEYLAESLKTSLSLVASRPRLPPKFTLWLYIIGAVAIFDGHEQAFFQPALTQVLLTLELKSWNEVRQSIKSMLWVDALHDPAAEQVVTAILR